MKFNTVFFAKAADKFGIVFRLRTSYPVLDICNNYPYIKFTFYGNKVIEQKHRIRTAGNAGNNNIAGGNHFIFSYGIVDFSYNL